MLALTEGDTNRYYGALMLERLPDRIEPLGLADVGRAFRGELPIASLSRLVRSLSAADGKLAVELVLRIDERRIRVLTGHIVGELKLSCQRCLGEMRFPLDLHFKLGIVTSEAEGRRLPEGYEPLLATGDPVALAEIIEDEVILALPIVPLHSEDAACHTGYRNREPEQQRENPFAVLEKLKSSVK